MDVLGKVTTDCIALIYTSSTVYRAGRRLATRQQQELLRRHYGAFCASLIASLSPETAAQYESIHRHILQGRKEEAMSFRQAITDECNMTAVAGAIIAQVSITALSLPFLSSTHWTSRACFLIAITSGCLSVYYACVLQRIVGKLYNAEQIKEWLMMPGPETSTEEGISGGQGGSLAAIFILSAPFAMVKVSIFSFVIGLAIYQGLTFTKNLDNNAAPGDSRDSFIALMVGTGLCFEFFMLTFSAKDIESTIRSRPFRLNESSPHVTFDAVPGNLEREDASLERTLRTTPQLSPTTYQEETVHEREPAIELQSLNNPQTQVLASLLKVAARAHEQCAEADRRVAAALSNSSTQLHMGQVRV